MFLDIKSGRYKLWYKNMGGKETQKNNDRGKGVFVSHIPSGCRDKSSIINRQESGARNEINIRSVYNPYLPALAR